MRHALAGLVYGFTPSALFGADDDGDGDGEPDPSQAEGDAGDGDGGEGEGDDPITFSQEDMSKVRGEAAGHRVKGKETQAALDKAEAELKELKQAEMTEIEKLKSDLAESQTAATEAEAGRVAALADAASFKILTSVTLAAIEAGFQDPADVLGMISQDEIVDDEGEVVTKTIKARLKSLGDKKPYLLKQPGSGSGDGGPTGRPEDADSDEAQVTAYHNQFLNQGRVSRVKS